MFFSVNTLPRTAPTSRKSLRSKLHEPVIAELKQVHQSEKLKKFNRKIRLEYLKNRAKSIEHQIVSDLTRLHELHHEELAVLREEFKNQNIEFQRDLEQYFRHQKKYIESVVYEYAVAMLELDQGNFREIEKMLKKMVEELGMEVEERIWGEKRHSKWQKFKRFCFCI